MKLDVEQRPVAGLVPVNLGEVLGVRGVAVGLGLGEDTLVRKIREVPALGRQVRLDNLGVGNSRLRFQTGTATLDGAGITFKTNFCFICKFRACAVKSEKPPVSKEAPSIADHYVRSAEISDLRNDTLPIPKLGFGILNNHRISDFQLSKLALAFMQVSRRRDCIPAGRPAGGRVHLRADPWQMSPRAALEEQVSWGKSIRSRGQAKFAESFSITFARKMTLYEEMLADLDMGLG